MQLKFLIFAIGFFVGLIYMLVCLFFSPINRVYNEGDLVITIAMISALIVFTIFLDNKNKNN